MDHFAAYAHQATTTSPPRLIGAMKTRAEARQTYSRIVERLAGPRTTQELEALLVELKPITLQVHAELQFLWDGDGDFAGLRKEIERAFVRLDPGLDYPRDEQEEGTEQ